jgi:dethiobiotin synthetase
MEDRVLLVQIQIQIINNINSILKVTKIFITSTGTNVGKSYILSALLHCLKDKFKVRAFKPMISGFNFDDVPNDLYLICKYLDIDYNQQNINKLTRYFYKLPLSPDMAAIKEKAEAPEIDVIDKFISDNIADSNSELALIEGAGGLYVPLNDRQNTMGLIKKTADEVILVCGSYLGSLSHSISAYENLRSNHIKINSVIVTENLPKSDELHINIADTVNSLNNFIEEDILYLPRFEGGYDEIIKQLSKELKRQNVQSFFRI